jgi:hypothetical protein
MLSAVLAMVSYSASCASHLSRIAKTGRTSCHAPAYHGLDSNIPSPVCMQDRVRTDHQRRHHNSIVRPSLAMPIVAIRSTPLLNTGDRRSSILYSSTFPTFPQSYRPAIDLDTFPFVASTHSRTAHWLASVNPALFLLLHSPLPLQAPLLRHLHTPSNRRTSHLNTLPSTRQLSRHMPHLIPLPHLPLSKIRLAARYVSSHALSLS